MNRTEAQNRENWMTAIENVTTGLMAFDEMSLHKHIDKIYNDFDSRTCENCIHGGDNYNRGDCPMDDAIWASGALGDSFGCNTFERVENGKN